MSFKERLRRQLETARQTSESFLADFKSPEHWFKQIYEGANHALWFVGHMAHTDNFFISVIAPQEMKRLPVMESSFGMGSQPTSDPSKYPPVDEVLGYMRERRETLLRLLDGMSDADLATKTPPGTPEFIPDYGSIFEMAIWHEGMHSGQLSVVRRSLGHKPLF